MPIPSPLSITAERLHKFSVKSDCISMVIVVIFVIACYTSILKSRQNYNNNLFGWQVNVKSRINQPLFF